MDQDDRVDGYREVGSPKPLDPYVETFWTWQRGRGPVPATHRVLPDGCIDILLSFETERTTDIARLSVVGTMTRPLDVPRRSLSWIVAVRFRPGGARHLLGCPAGELTDRRLPLGELWGAEAGVLLDRLLCAPNAEQRLRTLESALLERLATSPPDDDPRLAAAVRLVERHPGDLSVDEVAETVGWSPRQLRRRFVDRVGIGPKQLSRILRLRRLHDQAVHGLGPVDWAALALDSGYYDQAHMINEFRRWTGLSPSRYLASRPE